MIQFKTLAETLMVYFLQLQVCKTLLPVGTLLSLDLRNAVLEITWLPELVLDICFCLSQHGILIQWKVQRGLWDDAQRRSSADCGLCGGLENHCLRQSGMWPLPVRRAGGLGPARGKALSRVGTSREPQLHPRVPRLLCHFSSRWSQSSIPKYRGKY